jgi:hypothetical protein
VNAAETTQQLIVEVDLRLLDQGVYRVCEESALPELDDLQRGELFNLLRLAYGAGYTDRHLAADGETLFSKLDLRDPRARTRNAR